MSNAYSTVKPPVELIHYTCGHGDIGDYLASGREVATQFELAAMRNFGKISETFDRILDFGCGSGRLLDALDLGNAKVSGCDVGEAVAAFSKTAFPQYDIRHTDLFPPLPFSDGTFDLVYSFSVFSHLEQKVEDQWLEELHRVGSDNCAYLVTVQGDWMIEATLNPQEREYAESNGFYFKAVHGENNGPLAFPKYYEASYHTSDYIRKEWSTWFDIIEVIRGDNPYRHLFGDHTFEQDGGNIPRFRPMGQDLVVMRRRSV